MNATKFFLIKRYFSNINVSKDVDPGTIEMSFKTYDSRFSNSTPLVVLHGLLGSKLSWKSFCMQFNEETQPARRIIAIDLRDHGESPHTNYITYPQVAEDIKHFLNKKKIKKSCFLGHCFGGRGLMCFGLKYPDYIDKMIIVDASTERATPFQQIVPEILKHLTTVNIPQRKNIVEAREEVKKQLEYRILDKRLLNFILTNLSRKPDGSTVWKFNFNGILSNFESHLLYFPKDNYYVFKGPVLFINGEKSTFLIKEDHKNILNLFPKAKFYSIKGAGHWVHIDKPQEFIKVCLNFLNEYD